MKNWTEEEKGNKAFHSVKASIVSLSLESLVRLTLMLTIESLDPCHIIWVQPEVGLVASIDRSHECLSVSGVPKAQGMTHFMGCDDAQVHSLVGPLSPEFIFVEVYTAKFWDVGMGQDLSWRTVKADSNVSAHNNRAPFASYILELLSSVTMHL